ncbi:MAG: carnitine dehydratase [Gammaproteobacteria bacterium]|nr:carnitine dehydratase [Gammaproteobacteria bacterium]
MCDFTGQLAGAGATKWLTAFGAEVIRIEDPVREGRWDIMRGGPPFVDERRGINLGGSFNNHNTDKLGITLNLRTGKGKEILTEIIKHSDAVTENFSAGVLEKWGFGYEQLQKIKSDIVYVSNCGFGHVGPYSQYKTWGPLVQAVSGLTFSSSLPGEPPAGWGFSYMDHTGAYYMVIAILAALYHRQRTGEGQWVDLSCTDAAVTLNGPALLDWTVNDRPMRRENSPNSNRSQFARMAPHGIYPCTGNDDWIAIACRDDADWQKLAAAIDAAWTNDYTTLQSRLDRQDKLDAEISSWTEKQDKFLLQNTLRSQNIPVAALQKPQERIDWDPTTNNFGLWPTVEHPEMGNVRVDGLPVHMSKTDWEMNRGGPCLGEHTEEVLINLLGMTTKEVQTLREENVI